MKRTNRLILLIGVLLAAVAFVGIIFVFNNQQGGGVPPANTANVVVASRDIKLGDTIVAGSVSTKQIPLTDKKPDEYADPGEVIGQVARTDIATGAIVTQAMFAGTGAPSIAKDLPTGIRAMAVRVDAVSGVGTLILPGDRVDVVVTFDLTPVTVTPGQAGAPPTVTKQDAITGGSSKILLQNVEVRGIIGTTAASTGAQTGTAAAVDPLSSQQIVILGVTPQQAEVLEFLQQKSLTKSSALAANDVTLILRSPKDKDLPPDRTTGIILDSLIKQYGLLPPGVLEANLPKP